MKAANPSIERACLRQAAHVKRWASTRLRQSAHLRLSHLKESVMSLLESIAGQVLGSLSTSGDARHAGLVEAIGSLINQHPGGLAGLVSTFERNGLGGLVASWVGTGANLPISPGQLQSVLGSEQL